MSNVPRCIIHNVFRLPPFNSLENTFFRVEQILYPRKEVLLTVGQPGATLVHFASPTFIHADPCGVGSGPPAGTHTKSLQNNDSSELNGPSRA